MNLRKHILFFINLFFFTALLDAQDEGMLRITKFTSRDHKANRVNLNMIQNKRGIIYFGNSDGILEYDGYYWNTIEIPNRTPVRALTETASGKIFAGTVGDFGYIDKDKSGRHVYISLLNKLNKADRTFLDIYKAYSIGDTVYYATEDKLIRVLPDRSASIFKQFKTPVYTFQFKNSIYITDFNNNMHLLKSGSLIPVHTVGPHLKLSSTRLMLPISPSELLIYIDQEGFYVFDTKKRVFRKAPDFTSIEKELKGKTIYSSCVIENGYYAFGTTRGLYLFDQRCNKIRRIDTSTGLTDDGVIFLTTDKEKNLWVLNQMGINCIETASPFTIFSSEQGLKGAPYSILRYNGTLYITTDYSTFYLKNGRFIPINGDLSESWGLLNFKISKNRHKLMVGTSHGLFEIKNNSAIPVMTDKIYLDLSQSYADSSILLAGLYESKSLALFQFKNNKWITKDAPEKLSYQSIGAIQTPSGQIWINNYYKGISTAIADKHKPLKKWEVYNFNENNGLPPVSPYSLMHYYNGRMIFSNDYGLHRFNDKTKKFEKDDAFGINKASGNKGIIYLCWDKDENASAAFLNNKETEIGVCTKVDANKYTWDFVPFRKYSNADICTMYAEKNLVWVATTDGLIRYDRRIKRNYNIGFNTLIRKITCHQDSVIYYGNDSSSEIALKRPLGYAYNSIMIQVSSTFYEKPKQTRYSYYLEGVSKKWTEWTTNNTKEYNNLREGKYTLRVRSKNIYGFEGKQTSFTFTVLAPLYRTSSAYFFYIICTIIIISLINTLNSRRLNLKNRKLEIKVKKRTLEIMKKNKQLEQQKSEIQKQAEELKHANETKDKFFSIIAHDLRAPFNGIIGLLTLLKEYYNDYSDEERKGFIDEIDNSAHKTLDMLNDLLTWARTQNKRIDIEKEKLFVYLIAEKIINTLKSSAQKKNITLVNKTNPTHIVYVDKNTIHMVITNLVNNAIKFTPEGGEVSISAEYNESEILIQVNDNGVGIAPDDIEKIFRIDVNFTTPGTHDEKGTGLGLILCKEFIELNNGHISVESVVNQGTTFTIHLPINNNI